MKISVITATFNSADTIKDALDSVAQQSYSNIEHLIIDGQSKDTTLDIVKNYSNSKMHFRSESDSGIYDALNKGIIYSSGDVVGFLHADDVFESNGVLSTIAEAFSDPNVDAIYGDLIYVRKENIQQVVRYWRAGNYRKNSFYHGWMLPHPTLYVRRAVYEKYGGFNTSYRISADYDLVLKMFTRPGFRATYIPDVLVKMRLGGVSNGSLRQVLRKSSEDYRILRAHGVGGWLSLVAKNIRKLSQFRGRP